MRMTYAWLVVLAVAGVGAGGGSVRLIDAVKAGDWDTVRALQTARRGQCRRIGRDDAVHWGARLPDDRETADLLIRAARHVKAANRYGVTPLSFLLPDGSGRLIESLINAGADPNEARPEGETALMTAARTGHADAVTVLLAHGADVNASERWQAQTALMWAASENHADVVRLLIQGGADTNARSKEWTFPDYSYSSPMAVFQLPRGGWTA